MNNLITISDFETYPINIAPDNDFGNDNLTDVITVYQPEILTNLLGAVLYNQFENDCIGIVPQTQRFIDLLNGKTYVKNGFTLNYFGLKNMLVGFTYFIYTRLNTSFSTQTGEVKPNNQNSNPADIRLKCVNAYNYAINFQGEKLGYSNTFINYMDFYKDLYPEFDSTNLYKRINILGF